MLGIIGKTGLRMAVAAVACAAFTGYGAERQAGGKPGADRQPGSKESGEWPGWRGPNRDGKSMDRGLLKKWPEGGPELLWQASDLGAGFSTVAVTGGTVYATGARDGKLFIHAYDLKGQLKWRTEHGSEFTASNPGSRSTPVLSEGRIYVESGQGKVGCYTADSGKAIWSRELREFGGEVPQWGFTESVLIARSLAVITPGGRNCMVALDKVTGQEKWKSEGNGGKAQYGSPLLVVYKKVPMVIAGTSKGLVAVHPGTGNVLWTNDFCAGNVANCPTAAYADGYVFWANGYGKGGICLKLDEAGEGKVDASEAWRTAEMVSHHGGYIIHDGHIYGNHNDGFACLELKTGKKLWFAQGPGKGSLCFADGMLYLFGERNGRAMLATASPDGFEKRGEFSVKGSGPSWAHPVVAGGRLYLRYDTNLYCYDVREGGR